VSTLRTVLRPLLIALLALALAPAAASASVIDIAVMPASGADLGDAHTVTGKITGAYGAPLVGRSVVLEARPYPFKSRRYKAVETATSGLDGRFAFDHAFDRASTQRGSVCAYAADERFLKVHLAFHRALGESGYFLFFSEKFG